MIYLQVNHKNPISENESDGEHTLWATETVMGSLLSLGHFTPTHIKGLHAV